VFLRCDVKYPVRICLRPQLHVHIFLEGQSNGHSNSPFKKHEETSSLAPFVPGRIRIRSAKAQILIETLISSDQSPSTGRNTGQLAVVSLGQGFDGPLNLNNVLGRIFKCEKQAFANLSVWIECVLHGHICEKNGIEDGRPVEIKPSLELRKLDRSNQQGGNWHSVDARDVEHDLDAVRTGRKARFWMEPNPPIECSK
jgi:hypothetical protein